MYFRLFRIYSLLLFFLRYRVMFSPGWPQTHYVTEDGLKLLICLSLISKHWHSRTIPLLPVPSSLYPSTFLCFFFFFFSVYQVISLAHRKPLYS